jgi:cell wall assembly regulator SMI1
MRTRGDIHREFVERFHVGDRDGPVSDSQLDAIEAELNTRLPRGYREFMARHGPVYTPDTLQEIVEGNIDHPDIQNILNPAEAVDGTKAYWSAGMPSDVIGIGSDCMGNMIGFRRQEGPSDDSPVVFFDHDFLEVYEVAPSLDEFLAWYLDHLKGRRVAKS